MSLGTRIVQYVKQHQDQNTNNGNVSCVRPAFLNSHPFLQTLKRQVEECREDTDSENDMRALKRCLGGTLQQEDTSLGDYEVKGSQSTISELNIARLAISVSFDASCGDGSFGEEGLKLGESEERSPLEEKSDNRDSASDIIQSQEEGGMKVTADLKIETDYKPDFCTTPQLIRCPRKKEAFIQRETKVPSELKRELIFNISHSTQNLPDTDTGSELEFTEYMHHQHQIFGESRRAPQGYPRDCNHTCDDSSRIVKEVSSRHQTGSVFTKSCSSVRSPRKKGDLTGENEPAFLYQPTYYTKFATYSSPKSSENGDPYEKAKKNIGFPGEVGTGSFHQPTYCKKRIALCSAPKPNENGDSPDKTKKNGNLRSARGRKLHQAHPQPDLAIPPFSPHRESMHDGNPGELKMTADFPGEFNKNCASSSAQQTQTQSSPLKSGSRYDDFYRQLKIGDFNGKSGKNDGSSSVGQTQVHSSPSLSGSSNEGFSCKLNTVDHFNKNKIADFPTASGKNDGSSSACQNQTQSSPSASGNQHGASYKYGMGDYFGSYGRSEPHQTTKRYTSLQSPGKGISQHPLANSCPGVLNIAEEFLYEDLVTGTRLIETRCPSLLSLVSR